MIIIIIMLVIVLSAGDEVFNYLRPRKYRRRIGSMKGLFGYNYLDTKFLYQQLFREIPCTTFINELELNGAYRYIRERYQYLIVDVFQTCHYNREKGEQEFTRTVLVLQNKMVLELSGAYCEILYSNRNYAVVQELLKDLSGYRLPVKQEDFEINIITHGQDSLQLKTLEIKPTELDIDLFYNDDFKEVDAIIRERLSREEDKGIILLHGLPGTGKTTYLRHLIGSLNKKVLFVSPTLAGNLMNPEFLEVLISNPNAVLIIEDAENIIMDRKANAGSSVSNLLNLSDGLLSDCLNVQIICTFNSALSLVDEALMRKGRLIARYEFGKLEAAKAQRLSDHLGLDQIILKPMTLAEITHPGEKEFMTKPVTVGFRRN